MNLPPPRPPTLRDVARKAGCSPSAASMALRNHPSIPEPTRVRVRAAAAEVGYRPDPLLDAFNSKRLAHRQPKHPVSVAFVEVRTEARSLATGVDAVLEGVRAGAEGSGYPVDAFQVGTGDLTADRLAGILVSRGISGLILYSRTAEPLGLDLEWDRFSCVRIGSPLAGPALDSLRQDHWHGVRTAYRRLREQGFQRIGMAIREEDERRHDRPFVAGMLVEQNGDPEPFRVRPLVLPPRSRDVAGAVAAWARKAEPDALLHLDPALPLEVAALDPRLKGMPWACLDLPPGVVGGSGIRHDGTQLGREAVSLLSVLLKTHRRGLPALPSTTYLPGVWTYARR